MSQNKDKAKPQDNKQTKKQTKTNEIQKDAQVLKLLEQDEDDFEEFEEDAYDQNPPVGIDAKQWREDWEDEDVDDDFANKLKAELKA